MLSPPSRPGGGGRSGATRRVGRGRPPAPPGGHNCPAPRCAAAATTTAGLTVPAPAARRGAEPRVTPTRSRGRSQPLARGETPTWLPGSAAPPLPLLRLRHPPPLPGSRPTAQPRSRRERSPAPRAASPARPPGSACPARAGGRAYRPQRPRLPVVADQRAAAASLAGAALGKLALPPGPWVRTGRQERLFACHSPKR